MTPAPSWARLPSTAQRHWPSGLRLSWRPLSLLTAVTLKSKARIHWPWFILLFCLAALLNTLLPAFAPTFGILSHLGKIGLTVTLFLIGTGLNKKTLNDVGPRPLLQGLALWIIVGTGTLALILFNWIRV